MSDADGSFACLGGGSVSTKYVGPASGSYGASAISRSRY